MSATKLALELLERAAPAIATSEEGVACIRLVCAELRAARAVVEAARQHVPLCSAPRDWFIENALTAYDAVTKGKT